jgi:hypothetical protein
MRNARVEGTYFQPQTRQILAVDSESSAPGEPWIKFSDDYGLGLLAARRELENSGLMNDSSGVQWRGMSEFDPVQRRRTSNLIRALKEDSDRLRREVEDNQGFRQRLASIFTSPLRSRGEEA